MTSKHEVGSSSSSSSSSSIPLSSPQYSPPSPTSHIMSQLAGCNMLINQLINSNFIDGNGLCIFCNTSLHLHNQVATPTSITTSSSSSASKLNKFLINDLPKWKKPYKTCTPFFTALEMLFSLHDVTDETLYKKYLQLSLSELPEHEKTYAYSHITSDSSLSWSRVKILFAERFESYDHVSRLEKQYAALKYNHDDTIQSFSHRFINLCSELSYDTDSRMAINNFMRLLPHDMHQRFLMQCHVRKMTISSFNSLDDIIADITAMENAYHSARFIHHRIMKMVLPVIIIILIIIIIIIIVIIIIKVLVVMFLHRNMSLLHLHPKQLKNVNIIHHLQVILLKNVEIRLHLQNLHSILLIIILQVGVNLFVFHVVNQVISDLNVLIYQKHHHLRSRLDASHHLSRRPSHGQDMLLMD